jgi:hypothetical protein
MSPVEPWQTLKAQSWNDLLNNVELLKSNQITIPAWWVLAFNLDECPTGWLPANGNWSIKWKTIPDLRGKFIRWLNSFENGSNKLNTWSWDLDGIDRILGSFQDDQIRVITGRIRQESSDYEIYEVYITLEGAFTSEYYTKEQRDIANDVMTTQERRNIVLNTSLLGNNYSWKDSHPKNIALIYCIKE